MRDLFRKWWPWLRLVLFLLVLTGVSYHFWKILQAPELQANDRHQTAAQYLWHQIRNAQPLPMVLCGALYVGGLGFFAWFWLWLLKRVGQPLDLSQGIRAYYISHLGKYAPGKGVALLLRTSYAAQGGVKPGAGALTSAYETLTTMAAGAMVAALLLLVQARSDPSMLWKALGLLVLAGIPIWPSVFNLGVRVISARFRKAEEPFLPKLKSSTLITGLAVTAFGWFAFGASLLAVMTALAPTQVQWSTSLWLNCTAIMAISYVAGFLAIFTPGGLGVRELLLQQFLKPYVGEAQAVVAVLVLRLLWTLAEVVMAFLTYWLPTKTTSPPEELDVSGSELGDETEPRNSPLNDNPQPATPIGDNDLHCDPRL